MLSYRGEAEEAATTIGVRILSKGNIGMLGYRGEGEGSWVVGRGVPGRNETVHLTALSSE
jgi:hypothetical protein